MSNALCVFSGRNVAVLSYVDDLIMFKADEDSIDNLYYQPGQQFQVNDLQKSTQFVGRDISWTDDSSLKSFQKELNQMFLDETSMECSRPVHSHIDESAFASSVATELLDKIEHVLYYSVIGSIMYIAMGTVPDLLFVTRSLRSCLCETR